MPGRRQDQAGGLPTAESFRQPGHAPQVAELGDGLESQDAIAHRLVDHRLLGRLQLMPHLIDHHHAMSAQLSTQAQLVPIHQSNQ